MHTHTHTHTALTRRQLSDALLLHPRRVAAARTSPAPLPPRERKGKAKVRAEDPQRIAQLSKGGA
eukprot:1177333-Rhodomonas_salina.1